MNADFQDSKLLQGFLNFAALICEICVPIDKKISWGRNPEREEKIMSSIMPEGAGVRKAVQWISKMREEGGTPLATLIDQASARFNLSPKDSDFLHRFFTEAKGAKEQKS
jgi:hypothetical protein